MRGDKVPFPQPETCSHQVIKIKIPIENQEGVQPLPAPLTRGDGSVVCDLTSVLRRERYTERFPCKEKVTCKYNIST